MAPAMRWGLAYLAAVYPSGLALMWMLRLLEGNDGQRSGIRPFLGDVAFMLVPGTVAALMLLLPCFLIWSLLVRLGQTGWAGYCLGGVALPFVGIAVSRAIAAQLGDPYFVPVRMMIPIGIAGAMGGALFRSVWERNDEA